MTSHHEDSLLPDVPIFKDLEHFLIWQQLYFLNFFFVIEDIDINSLKKIVRQLSLKYHSAINHNSTAITNMQNINDLTKNLDKFIKEHKKKIDCRIMDARAEYQRLYLENEDKKPGFCISFFKTEGCKNPDCYYAHENDEVQIHDQFLGNQYLSDKHISWQRDFARQCASDEEHKAAALAKLYAKRHYIPGTLGSFQVYPDGIIVSNEIMFYNVEYDIIEERHYIDMTRAKKFLCKSGRDCKIHACPESHPSESNDIFDLVLQEKPVRLMWKPFPILLEGDRESFIYWWDLQLDI